MAINNRLIIDPSTGNGQGNFTSLKIRVDFLLEKNPDHNPGEENSPSHFVYLKSDHGNVDAGAAWLKTVSEGANRGSKFLSISIDDPSFEAPLNFYAFPDGKPADKNALQEYEIRWRRSRSREAA